MVSHCFRRWRGHPGSHAVVVHLTHSLLFCLPSGGTYSLRELSELDFRRLFFRGLLRDHDQTMRRVRRGDVQGTEATPVWRARPSRDEQLIVVDSCDAK